MKIDSFCLIQMPSEDALFGAVGTRILPLSLGIITGYLRQRGIDVDQFDLLPLMEEKCGSGIEHSEFERFFDKEAVFNYINGGDNQFFDEFVQTMLKDINIAKYDMVALSVGPHLSWVQTFAGLIFGEYIERHWQKPLVFGGFNLSSMINYRPIYDELFEVWLKRFPYIIIGPGEESLYKLIQALRNNEGDEEIHKINGLCYLNSSGNLVANPSEKRRIVMPDFDGLKLKDYYNCIKKDGYDENMISLFRYPFAFTKPLRNKSEPTEEGYEKTLIIPYIFNYNCPYNCAFCVESDPESPTPVIAKVEQVISELKIIKQKYNTPYFYFINNAVNLSKRYIRELCNGIIENNLNIYWSDCARFDNTDYEIIKLMYKAGCRKLVFGMESGSEGLIKRINKKIDLKQAEQVMSWCNEIGIWPELEIILGMPTEGQEDFLESYNYLKRNLEKISFMTINHYIPMPGSEMFRYPEKYNIEVFSDITWEDILTRDLQLFKNGKNPIHYNNMIKVYNFREIGQRDSQQIFNDTVEKIKRTKKLMDGKLMQEAMKYVQQGVIKMSDLQGIQRL
ncbi:B12-binding domain-containing radical SAM protein [Ruminiclostridium papyrosolvens]|uniref:Uncharacterized protein n=1 Tax=Ruminiclostridium papyrosolvens C7 TaxID=1330534 RepID=U4QZS3_9FIRM|nr:radical SAM protein [Ruminiclostridium papyrosolvens]EPR10507.1 hypothetical protein L323_13005 [Ruminiclostridium papyrosolvens C7]